VKGVSKRGGQGGGSGEKIGTGRTNEGDKTGEDTVGTKKGEEKIILRTIFD
jgi:hypothetical protein